MLVHLEGGRCTALCLAELSQLHIMTHFDCILAYRYEDKAYKIYPVF